MKQVILPLIFAASIFSSCSTSQKLNTIDEEMMALKNQVIALREENTSLSRKVSESEKQIGQLQTENALYKQEAENYRKAKDAVVRNMEAQNNMFENQMDSLRGIKQKAVQALNLFQHSGTEVKYRNGMIYISMDNLLMYSSGSIKVNEAGKKALSTIANLLKEYPQMNLIIVGNADSIKPKKGYNDNWSLSTERANSIVRLLQNQYGVDPTRLIAAGKSEYHPVASNGTAEGRARNRGSYIILNPNLNTLWILSQKYP